MEWAVRLHRVSSWQGQQHSAVAYFIPSHSQLQLEPSIKRCLSPSPAEKKNVKEVARSYASQVQCWGWGGFANCFLQILRERQTKMK